MTRRCGSVGSVRVVAVALVTALLASTAAVVAPATPAGADLGQFMWLSDSGSGEGTYGPNSVIQIYLGTIAYQCDTFYPVADVYVVSGAPGAGGALSDVSGGVNVVFGTWGGGIIDETIAVTAPAGSSAPATTAWSSTSARTARSTPRSTRRSRRHPVVFPPGELPPDRPSVIAFKGTAGQQAASLAHHDEHLQGLYLSCPRPTDSITCVAGGLISCAISQGTRQAEGSPNRRDRHRPSAWSTPRWRPSTSPRTTRVASRVSRPIRPTRPSSSSPFLSWDPTSSIPEGGDPVEDSLGRRRQRRRGRRGAHRGAPARRRALPGRRRRRRSPVGPVPGPGSPRVRHFVDRAHAARTTALQGLRRSRRGRSAPTSTRPPTRSGTLVDRIVRGRLHPRRGGGLPALRRTVRHRDRRPPRPPTPTLPDVREPAGRSARGHRRPAGAEASTTAGFDTLAADLDGIIATLLANPAVPGGSRPPTPAAHTRPLPAQPSILDGSGSTPDGLTAYEWDSRPRRRVR